MSSSGNCRVPSSGCPSCGSNSGSGRWLGSAGGTSCRSGGSRSGSLVPCRSARPRPCRSARRTRRRSVVRKRSSCESVVRKHSSCSNRRSNTSICSGSRSTPSCNRLPCAQDGVEAAFRMIAEAVGQLQESMCNVELKMERTHAAVLAVTQRLKDQGKRVLCLEQRMHAVENQMEDCVRQVRCPIANVAIPSFSGFRSSSSASRCPSSHSASAPAPDPGCCCPTCNPPSPPPCPPPPPPPPCQPPAPRPRPKTPPTRIVFITPDCQRRHAVPCAGRSSTSCGKPSRSNLCSATALQQAPPCPQSILRTSGSQRRPPWRFGRPNRRSCL